MPGPLPKLPESRKRRNVPKSGEWTRAPEGGWRFDRPDTPDGLSDWGQDVWRLWFGSWWAANWWEGDVPVLALVALALDEAYTGSIRKATSVVPMLDAYGITPKGRLSLRWLPPSPDPPEAPRLEADSLATARDARRKRLRVQP